MRFLLHHSNACYDATTKTWTFNLDRRFSNPRSISIQKAVFQSDTDVDPPPNIVYMHSAALTRMFRTKHTVVLTASNHETPTDVVCVLEQQNIQKRYLTDTLTGHNKLVKSMFRLENPEPSRALNHDSHNRSIDIFFTDGAGTRLGDLTPIDHGALIAALNPTMWLDPDHVASLTPVSAPLVVGGNVASWASRGVAGVLLNVNANKTAAWTVFGATKSMLYALDSTKMHDNSGVQPQQNQNSTICMMFKTGTSVSSQANLVRTSILDVYVKSGFIKYKTPSHPDTNQAEVATNLAVAIGTAYRLTCVRTTTTPLNTYVFTLKTLDGPNAGTIQSQDKTYNAIANMPTDHLIEYGAQYTEGYEYSHYVEVPGVQASETTALHDYMDAKYNGTVSYEPGKLRSTFFAELKINVR